MRSLVGLARDVLLDEVVFVFPGNNDMYPLSGESADVGTEHDRVRSVASKCLHIVRTANTAENEGVRARQPCVRQVDTTRVFQASPVIDTHAQIRT